MKIRRSVKILSLLLLMVISMGIAMSIDRVGEENKMADSEHNTTLVTGEEKAKESIEDQRLPGIENKEMPGFPMSDSFSLLKSLMALSFVLGLIFLAAFLFKKYMGINSTGMRSNRIPIQMIGNLPLGDKKFLSIVEIQGKHFFLGISQNSINLLSELELDFSSETGASGNEENQFENIFQKARSLLKNQQPPIVRMKNEKTGTGNL